MKGIVKSYNETVHGSHGFTPNEAEKAENIAAVINNLEDKRDYFMKNYTKAYQEINRQFHIGDTVRYKLPTPPFAKEARQHFSQEHYKIIDIVNSGPLRGFKLSDIHTNAIVPGSFLPEQLLQA